MDENLQGKSGHQTFPIAKVGRDFWAILCQHDYLLSLDTQVSSGNESALPVSQKNENCVGKK